jgi:tetratricopeptide (TPR) repeat protein
LSLAVLAAYSNHFQNDFHFDDFHTVSGNPFVRDLRNIPRFFSDPKLFSTMPDHATWRPIVSTSLAIDYRLGGGFKPFWFHLSTFLWYLVQLALMFALFRLILDWADPHPSNDFTALLATAAYGLHPVMAETVNYVIQRGDLYVALGLVASLYCFARWPEQRKYCWYLTPAVLAYLSKAPALIFPLILLVYVWLFERDRNPLRATWPAFVVTAAAAVLTSFMTPRTFNAGAASALQYRVTQPWIAVHYLKSFFVPTELSADADWGYVGPWSTEAVVGYVVLAGLIVIAWLCSRPRETRPVAFGIAWFILALLPTSLMPLAEVTNDHRMFLPFVGLALAVVWGLRLALFHATERLTRNSEWVPRAVAVMMLLLLAAGLGAHARNEVWRSEETLWRDVTEKSPHNGRGLMNYGLIFMARGDYPSALSYFERAVPYTPNYWALEDNLGIALGALRRGTEAEQHFRRAIDLAPGVADPYFFYGRWLQSAGRIGESAAELELAVRLNRFAFDARDLLLRVYAQEQNGPALQRLAAETLELAPDDAVARGFFTGKPAPAGGDTPETLLDLSLALFKAGRYDESVDAAKKALALRPDYAEAYNNIAAAYNALQRWDDGIQAATQAVRLKPDFQLARNNLMWALNQREKAK